MAKTGYNNFKIGDLVIYAPYCDGEGAWEMNGDLGIVLSVAREKKLYIVKVKWINPEMDETDMSSDVLVKVEIGNDVK